ncbi:hypothetical protein I7X12_13920 [Halosimplex litoreum]|uniref:Uncharacterized protein n=1 Tax=Halosimplex litoreum TaxID=1198301 RepID=A0A7T3KU29_9EURY|nr:hypothetical protein [Halosimplex litoreum]QPV61842.1 hypothetical protein I7X12_13920 [Halosimplex litoreum]
MAPRPGSSTAGAVLWGMLAPFGTLAVLVGACGLGYREARHRDVGRTYLRYVGTVAGAGATVMLLVFVGGVVLGGSSGSAPFVGLLSLVTLLVGLPGVLTVAALAGVSLASTRGDDAPVRSTRELLPVAVGTGAVAGVGFVLESVADLATAAGGGVGVAASLPQFGSAGRTLVTYLQAGRLAGDLTLIGAGIVVGVLAVRRRGVAAPSRRFVGVVGAGALTGLLVAWAPVMYYVTSANAPTTDSVETAATALASAVVSTAAVAAFAVVAGVGVARFGTDEGDADGSEDTDGLDFEPVTETPASERSLRDH